MKVIGNRISRQVSTYVGSGAIAGVLKSSGAVRVPWKQERGPEVPATLAKRPHPRPNLSLRDLIYLMQFISIKKEDMARQELLVQPKALPPSATSGATAEFTALHSCHEKQPVKHGFPACLFYRIVR